MEAPRARAHIGIFILAGLFLNIAGLACAQDKPVNQQPVEQKAPLSGAHMFMAYCASCHGKDAKGNGPVATALKQPPADLTTLAKRHEGKFPDRYVQDVLRNGVKAPAHGDAEMPVWGPLFRSMDSDPMFMHVRISSLMIYLKSLQVK
jgi:mono/diheme cytochrome c family protein